MTGRDLIQVYGPENEAPALVDFVAVHGLKLTNDANPVESTWTHEDSRGDKCNWLTELLPKCETNGKIRVMVYTYNSNPFVSAYQEELKDEVKNFLQRLMGMRRGPASSRPLFMIGYSLGGILIKAALVAAKLDDYSESQAIYLNTFAVTFMGTPHYGARGAGPAQFVANVAGVFRGYVNPNSFLDVCRKNSLYARSIADQYRELFETYYVYSIYETLETNGKMVVTRDSAVLNLSGSRERTFGVNANHIDLSKFKGETDSAWLSYLGWTELMVAQALDSVRTRERLQDLGRPLVTIRWSPIDTMIHSRAPHFIGREFEMSELQQLMSAKSFQPRVALWGASGTGKTSVAVEYCYRLKSLEKHSVFWVSAKSDESIMMAYEELARRANLSIPSQTAVEDVCGEVRQWLESPRSHCWTMVLDGMDDRKLTSRKFLPTRRGAILVTTRQKEVVGDVVDPNHGLEVMQCNLQDAKDILKSRLGNQAGQAVRTSEDLESVCQKLECHPLALVQAGDFIRNKSITIPEFLRYIEENEIDTETFFSYSGRYTWDEHERPSLAVMTTWNITFNSLAEEMPSALLLLEKISLLSDELIPGELIHGPRKSLSFTNDMAALINYSLVFNMNFQGYRMHRLVSFFTRKRAELDNNRFRATVTGTIDMVVSVYPKEEKGTQVSQMLPHALQAFQHGERNSIARPTLKTLGQLLANCLLHLGKLSRAQEHIVVALRLHDEGILRADEEAAAFLEDSARVLWQNDDGEEMLRRISQAREIYETRLGKSDTRTIRAERRQIMALNQLGHHRKAIEMYEDSLDRIQKSPERNKLPAFNLMNSIGQSYFHLGEWQVSLGWHRRARDGYLGLRGTQNYDDHILEVEVSLARSYSKVHNYNEAHKLLKSCEDAFKKKNEPDHYRVALIKEDRAEVFLEEKKYDKAIPLYLEALAGYEAANAFTGRIASNIGEAYKRDEEFDKSMRYLLRSLKEKEQKYGKINRSTIISIRNLGDLFETQSRFTLALQWYREALSRSQNLDIASAPGEIQRANFLISRVLFKLHRYKESSDYCKQVLDESERLGETQLEKYYEYKQLCREIAEEQETGSDQEWELSTLI